MDAAHHEPEPLPVELDGRILDHPVWWTDRNDRAVTLQVLHPTHLRPGEPRLCWLPDEVQVVIDFTRPATSDHRTGLAEMSTRRVELKTALRDRRVRVVADGIPVPCRRLPSHVSPAPHKSPPRSAKIIQDLVPAGVDGLRISNNVVTSCSPITFEHMPADDVLADELDVEVGDAVLHIERVWSANGETVLLESSHLRKSPFVAFPGAIPATAYLGDACHRAFGHVVAHSENYVEVTTASHREAELTGTAFGAPMLVAHSISYSARRVPLFRVRAVYRGDRIALAAEQQHTC